MKQGMSHPACTFKDKGSWQPPPPWEPSRGAVLWLLEPVRVLRGLISSCCFGYVHL